MLKIKKLNESAPARNGSPETGQSEKYLAEQQQLSEEDTIVPDGLKRRNFIQSALLSMAGLSILSGKAKANELKSDASILTKSVTTLKEETYWERTDSFEDKLNMLQSASDRKNHRLMRSISNSIRISALQAQEDQTEPSNPDSAHTHFTEVSALSAPIRNWAKGWRYCKIINISQTFKPKRNISEDAEYLGYPVNYEPDPNFRSQEPVDLLLSFLADQVQSLKREIRVARLQNNKLTEIPSQVYEEIRRGNKWYCNLIFLADRNPNEKHSYLIFYGNPDAELPEYISDLNTEGDGYALDIQNDFFKVKLSRQSGQIESMFIKRERGLELYSGGQGHGEVPGIDWAHDYMAQGQFQKFRTTLWDECPDYEIIRGPVCTIVRRWGFPYSPIHPVFSPSRMNMHIEYRFYSGLPYFTKSSKFRALKELIIDGLRDDEWVLTGQAFTNGLWIGEDGKVRLGEVDPKQKNKLWGTGLYNKDNMDSFIGLFLEHRAEGLEHINHSGSPILFNKWHGQLWSRHVLEKDTKIPAGTTLHQKNAYLTIPFTETEGPGIVEDLRNELLNPSKFSHGTVSVNEGIELSSSRLARPGEAGDSPISKDLLWKALDIAKDGQLLTGVPLPGLLSVVELGFVYDLVVKNDTVIVIFAMPHRGRPLGVYFESGSSSHESYKGSQNVPEALLKVPGVKKVIYQQTWYPAWTSNLITDSGRKKLNLLSL